MPTIEIVRKKPEPPKVRYISEQMQPGDWALGTVKLGIVLHENALVYRKGNNFSVFLQNIFESRNLGIYAQGTVTEILPPGTQVVITL